MNDPLGLDPETTRQLGYQTVDMLVDRLSAVAERPVIRRADIENPSWLGRRPADVSEMRGLPLFRDLTERELDLIAHSAYEDDAEPMVRQWDPSGEFYVLLDGTA